MLVLCDRPLRGAVYWTPQSSAASLRGLCVQAPCLITLCRVATLHHLHRWKKVESWQEASRKRWISRRKLFCLPSNSRTSSRFNRAVSFVNFAYFKSTNCERTWHYSDILTKSLYWITEKLTVRSISKIQYKPLTSLRYFKTTSHWFIICYTIRKPTWKVQWAFKLSESVRDALFHFIVSFRSCLDAAKKSRQSNANFSSFQICFLGKKLFIAVTFISAILVS